MRSPNSKRRLTRRPLKAAFSALFFFVLAPLAARAGPWSEHEQKIAQYGAKIFALERDLAEMIERKRTLDGDPKALSELLKELAKKHKELEGVAAEREEELAHMRFKHPEKGDLAEREYERYEPKSLADMEAEQGLDGKLDRLKAMIEYKFRLEKKPSRTPAEAGVKSGDPAASPREDDRIVLRK